MWRLSRTRSVLAQARPWRRCRGYVAALLVLGCADPALEKSPDAGTPEAGLTGDAPADLPGPPDTNVPFDLKPEVATPISPDAEPPPDGRRACEVVLTTEGPDLGVPLCPQTVPTEGAACQWPGGNGRCVYPNGCDTDDWQCVNGSWKRTAGRSCAACPAERPMNDSSCADLGETRPNFTCYWPQGPRRYAYARCFNCRWGGAEALNLESCPAALPKAGEPCAEQINCRYASACHNVDTAVCKGGSWEVSIGSCR